MSTFVVRFIGSDPSRFCGRVSHVRTGHEASFSSPEDLLAFFECMNATSLLEPDSGDCVGPADSFEDRPSSPPVFPG